MDGYYGIGFLDFIGDVSGLFGFGFGNGLFVGFVDQYLCVVGWVDVLVVDWEDVLLCCDDFVVIQFDVVLYVWCFVKIVDVVYI